MVMNRNCKVIATYFGPRRYFPQDIKDSIELIKEVIQNEIDNDPGEDLDVIVVNHNFENEEVIGFLNSVNGISINRGKLIVLNRPWENGIGMSYASYNYAYDLYKNQYDYWFFTEDDVITILPHYYRIAKNQLIQNKEVAFIGCHRCILEEGVPTHAHSGCGITNKKFIEKAISYNGYLPHSKLPMPEEVSEYIKTMDRENFLNSRSLKEWYRSAEIDGEIAFTNVYEKIGYSIQNIESELPVVKVYQQDSPYYL
jgi:hypothetical protein